MIIRNLFLAFISVLVISSCSSTDNEEKALIQDRPADVIYKEATAALENEEYIKAKTLFEEVERQHPYSNMATKAQLMSAFAAYQALEYDQALALLDRFIELHPGHEEIDYAWYLKAMCYYEQIADVARDQEMTRFALQAFDSLIRRFPDSKYARDAKYKKDLTLDHLAGKEMEIGRYYLTRKHVNAAINRFLTVVRDYQTTTHVPEALYRLVEAYIIIGLDDEAMKVAAVLGYNYPGSKWYEKAYALLDPERRKEILENRSWFNKTLDSILTPE